MKGLLLGLVVVVLGNLAWIIPAILWVNRREIREKFKGGMTKPNTEGGLTKSADDLCERATMKNVLSDYQGALADYTKAIELKPDHARAYYNRGGTKADLKDYQGALADYLKAIELKPDYRGEYYKNRGSAYLGLGQKSKAMADYMRATELGSCVSQELLDRCK